MRNDKRIGVSPGQKPYGYEQHMLLRTYQRSVNCAFDCVTGQKSR